MVPARTAAGLAAVPLPLGRGSSGTPSAVTAAAPFQTGIEGLLLGPLPLLGALLAGLLMALVLTVGLAGHVSETSLRERVPWPRCLGGTRAAGGSEAESDSDSALPPPSSLPEDERFVVELLQEHDGQVHQSTIVEASDWSKSKVSRLLSSMEAEGYVEKVAVGRENLIALPGHAPEE